MCKFLLGILNVNFNDRLDKRNSANSYILLINVTQITLLSTQSMLDGSSIRFKFFEFFVSTLFLWIVS